MNWPWLFWTSFLLIIGHTLIVPKRHVASLFEITTEEMSSCWELLHAVKSRLDERFAPDGFNVGVNVGEAAGQTVFHLHIHVIPRYKGDVPDPRGGIRRFKKSLVPWIEEEG
jgi:Diadenosine tetraphosphate (Ap4A) hydrolase and other HIT family hydrolases